MGLLLYKSDEMFSQEELEKNSKVIFQKITDNEIDKAIILNDSKAKFLVMDFQKYEDIMAEYEILRDRYNAEYTEKTIEVKNDIEEQSEQIIPEKQEDLDIMIDDIIDEISEEIQDEIVEEEETTKEVIEQKEIKKIDPAKVVPPRPEQKEEPIEEPVKEEEVLTYDEVTIVTKGIAEENNKNTETIKIDNNNEEEEIQEEPEIQEELTEEEEINQALETIKGIDFDDNMRAMAEAKIREKILKARKERLMNQAQQEETPEEIEQEEEIKQTVEVENQKKEKAISEFWS